MLITEATRDFVPEPYPIVVHELIHAWPMMAAKALGILHRNDPAQVRWATVVIGGSWGLAARWWPGDDASLIEWYPVYEDPTESLPT